MAGAGQTGGAGLAVAGDSETELPGIPQRQAERGLRHGKM